MTERDGRAVPLMWCVHKCPLACHGQTVQPSLRKRRLTRDFYPKIAEINFFSLTRVRPELFTWTLKCPTLTSFPCLFVRVFDNNDEVTYLPLNYLCFFTISFPQTWLKHTLNESNHLSKTFKQNCCVNTNCAWQLTRCWLRRCNLFLQY